MYWENHTDFFGHARVREGDRLTVLSHVGEEWIPEHVVANGTASADRFGWWNRDANYSGITFYLDEGIVWCRGWADDEGKRALLAAHALAGTPL